MGKTFCKITDVINKRSSRFHIINRFLTVSQYVCGLKKFSLVNLMSSMFWKSIPFSLVIMLQKFQNYTNHQLPTFHFWYRDSNYKLFAFNLYPYVHRISIRISSSKIIQFNLTFRQKHFYIFIDQNHIFSRYLWYLIIIIPNNRRTVLVKAYP